MEKIKVLHIVTYMGCGGLETMIMNYYRHIDRSKVQFDFIVHRNFEAFYDKEILELGGKIYRFPKLNPFSRDYLNKLDSFFAEHKEYRIVHSHLDCMAGIPLKAAKKYGVPVRIAHAHNSNQTKDKKYLLKLIYKKNIAKYSTYLFACSRAAGNWMFGKEQFTVLNNAIDAHKYCYNKEIADKQKSDLNVQNNLLVGHVGRFAPQKNHDFIIDIFAEILKKQTKSKLILVGDGELKNSIKDKAERLGISENIIFAGTRSDVPEILQAMDVFLFPSKFEGLGIAVIEAQAAGLPCIISDKVPIECKKTDLVEQLSLEASAKEWADAVINAAKMPRKNTIDEIKSAGFDICENAKQLEKFYLNAVKEKC